MTLIVEDGTIVENANSYISIAEFEEYHNARGNDYSSADTDQLKEQAIINAMDYIHLRWGSKFKGRVEDFSQELDFPRIRLYDRNGVLVEGIPKKLKNATAEYALRAITGSLMPDLATSTTGQTVRRVREKIGPIEEETEYAGSMSINRPYPIADALLSEYVNSSSGVVIRG